VGSRERWRAFSEEARALTTYDSPINMMVGILYQNTHLFADQDVYSGNMMNSAAPLKYQYVAFAKTSTTSGETVSPYAQVTWKIIPQVELAGGVRYTHETKDSFFVHPYVRPGQNYLTTPINTDQTFTNWTPEITISYKPSRNINIYAGYKTGYKSGGFSNESSYTTSSIPSDLAFGPEKARGFEGGVKTTLLNNQLRFDVALFRYKYTDLQVDFFEAQSFRYVTTNAGSARTSGVEVSSEFAPRSIPGLAVRGSLNYVKAHYIRFLAPCYTGETPAMGCNTASPFGGLFGQDLSGSPTANAPKWTASLGGIYETEVARGLKIGFSTDSRYSSSYIGSPFGNPLTRQPRYINVDASIYLRSDRGWELSVIGRNLSNQFVISGALDSPSTGSGTGTAAGRLADQRGYTNTPRTVQLQLTMRY
jgi:outer membrane receptor protein involved in Fe transport